jgi:hypothetical protein
MGRSSGLAHLSSYRSTQNKTKQKKKFTGFVQSVLKKNLPSVLKMALHLGLCIQDFEQSFSQYEPRNQ